MSGLQHAGRITRTALRRYPDSVQDGFCQRELRAAAVLTRDHLPADEALGTS